MKLKLTIVTNIKSRFKELEKLLSTFPELDLELNLGLDKPDKELGQIVFFDDSIDNLEEKLNTIDRKRRAIFLITQDGSQIPKLLKAEKVDDVLIHPFRNLEVLSKLKHYYRILMWDEVAQINDSFSQLIERLHDDLQLAERLQKSNLPIRFPDIKGFQFRNRYLIGGKSGGDFF